MKLASQVLSLQGEAFAVDKQGRRRALRVHDRIAAHERVELADGARLVLLRDDGERIVLDGEVQRLPDETAVPDVAPAAVEPVWPVRNEQVARVLRVKRFQTEAGWPTNDAEPAGGGHSFVQIERVHETVPGGYFEPTRPAYDEVRNEAALPDVDPGPEVSRSQRSVPGLLAAPINHLATMADGGFELVEIHHPAKLEDGEFVLIECPQFSSGSELCQLANYVPVT
ncbi:hypothetical protein [Paludibacterium purpuratum]|uniref:Uncharacterized protein n=1 Tax=Paludibacterium purpuratum TaxID=1144873 RepID=A0A4R7BEM6_9NEIS|nr:hypothetical protein [Paludibacterium purpuratum]TDR82127.1 hypothetical protein DFP86_102241 [Paludibacterium purpuratum]